MSESYKIFEVRVVSQDSIIPVQYFEKIEEATQYALALFGSAICSVSVWDVDMAKCIISLFR